MKPYAKTKKCWCDAVERCILCKPNKQEKKKSRRSFRKKNKNLGNLEHVCNNGMVVVY